MRRTLSVSSSRPPAAAAAAAAAAHLRVRVRAAALSTSPLTYLERWAGVRRETGEEGAQGTKGAPQNSDVGGNNSVRSGAKLTAVVSSGSYLIPTVRLHRQDTVGTLQAMLSARKLRNPLAQGSPIVLDLGAVCPDGSPHARPITMDALEEVLDILRRDGLVPMGVCNASVDISALAARAGLSNLLRSSAGMRASSSTSSRASAEPQPKKHDAVTATSVSPHPTPDTPEKRPASESGAAPLTFLPPMVHEGHVRSGQQIYAEGRSLVVLGTVNSLGEVLADGDIHIHGALNGRALAGLHGEGRTSSAKIFASKFNAELVGIGDSFQAFVEETERIPGLTIGAATCIRLGSNGRLTFKSHTSS